MAALSDDAKLFIIRRLAAHESPETVRKAVRADLGIEVSRQQVELYDPSKANGARLSRRWLVEFQRAREKFRSDLSDIPIAHKPGRLRCLQKMLDDALGRGNIVMAADLLAQAAHEMGDAFSAHSGTDRATIREFVKLTDAELLAELRALSQFLAHDTSSP